MGQKNNMMNDANIRMDTDIDKFKNQKILLNDNNHDIIELVSNNLANHINDVGTSESTQVNSKRLRQFIIKNIVQPVYVSDLKDTMVWRFRWKKIANCLYIFSKLLNLVGAVLAFSESYFKVYYLSLSAGIIMLLSTLILQLGDFTQKESKRNTYEANEILRSLDITGIPELDDAKEDTKQIIDKNSTSIYDANKNILDEENNTKDTKNDNISVLSNNSKKKSFREIITDPISKNSDGRLLIDVSNNEV